MLTVRFPNGQTVQYNNAHHLRYGADGWHLYAADPDKNGKWIASIQVSVGVIVETVTPCRVINPIDRTPIDRMTKEITNMKKDIKKLIKKMEGG